MIYRFIVPFSHSQFYLGDDGPDWDPSEVWTEKAVINQFAPMEEAVGIGVVREGGNVWVVVEILQRRPNRSFDSWDQVVECSVAAPSGRLRLCSPRTLDVRPIIPVTPGTYRLLVFYGNFDATRKRLERAYARDLPEYGALQRNAGDDERKLKRLEHIRLVLWPGKRKRPVFLKRLPKASRDR